MKIFEIVKKYCAQIEVGTIPFPSTCCRVILGKSAFMPSWELRLDRIPFYEGEDVERDSPNVIIELTEEQGHKILQFMKRSSRDENTPQD